ncbi:MAG: protein kinase, partial [Gammaproteobacteria bacterium]
MENLGDKIPVTIAGYRIEHELGRGGMSIVYLAVQESLQRRLAIKVMSPALTLDPAFKERFLREGRIVAQLNHPNIIIVYDINFMANRYFIAMEYVPGPTLAHRITQGLKLADSFYIVKRIARALDYAHRRGFVHRDIKPSNILFREDGEPVLADFGIAKAVESDTKLTKTGLTPGTPSYMSPEQIRGRELDGRSDIYSLGIVFYEMLIGELPYRGDSSVSAALMHLTEPVPKLPRHLVFLEPVIEGMLAKVPEERFENEQVFREAVDRAIATSRNPRILEEVTLGYDHDAGSERTKHRRKSAPNSRKSPQAVTWARLKSARQGWRWTTGAGALALLAGGTAFLLSEQGLDPRTQRAVDHLLVMAEQQLNQGQFIAPRNYNAYDTYREILAIAPDYKPALEGLDRIGAHFEQLAQQQREAAKPDNALRLVEQGLEVVPKHKDLLALKKSVIQQIAAEQRQQRIAKWYEAAEQQLANSQLAAPPGRNAFETYQKILKVDPNNQKALSGLQAVAAGMRDLAEKEFQQERFDESLAQLELGLRLFPNHQEMQALRDAVLKKKEIQTLLARAKQQIADLKHIEPAGNNAHESYRKVLALDPNNEEALSGIQRLVSGFAERARKKLSEGSMAEALGLIEDGFSVSPEDEALRTLQQE